MWRNAALGEAERSIVNSISRERQAFDSTRRAGERVTYVMMQRKRAKGLHRASSTRTFTHSLPVPWLKYSFPIFIDCATCMTNHSLCSETNSFLMSSPPQLHHFSMSVIRVSVSEREVLKHPSPHYISFFFLLFFILVCDRVHTFFSLALTSGTQSRVQVEAAGPIRFRDTMRHAMGRKRCML